MNIQLFSDLLKDSANNIRESDFDVLQYSDGWQHHVLSDNPPFQVREVYDSENGVTEYWSVTRKEISDKISLMQVEIDEMRRHLAAADNPKDPDPADLEIVRAYYRKLRDENIRKKALSKLSEEERQALGLE
jgi:sarcosine oxidase delta subunit